MKTDCWMTGGIEPLGAGELGKMIFKTPDGLLRGWMRGGIRWPWPQRIGTRTEIKGAVVALCYDAREVAHVIGWGECAAIGPTVGGNGVIERMGLSGLVRFAGVMDGVSRWATWTRSTDGYYDAVRVLRRHLGPISDLMRFWAVDTVPDIPEQVDAIIAQWAEEGKLDVPPELADEIEREDAAMTGLRPYAEALAAGLWMIEQNRPKKEKEEI